MTSTQAEMIEHVCKRAAWMGFHTWLVHGFDERGRTVHFADRDFRYGHMAAAVARATMELYPALDEKWVELSRTTNCFAAHCLGVDPNAMWRAYSSGAVSFKELHTIYTSIGKGECHDELVEWLC